MGIGVRNFMLLRHYLKEIELPNINIRPDSKTGEAFLNKNIPTLWDAIEYIHKLPYGRTTARDNYLQVLVEEKGACSVKHALLAALAEEHGIPLSLRLGIYFLTAENMPKITHVLHEYRLTAIPEAHCFLKYNNHTLDVTFPEMAEFSFKPALAEEITITPQQIGAFKVETHQAFIREWVKNKAGLNFDLVWAARELCIQELSQN